MTFLPPSMWTALVIILPCLVTSSRQSTSSSSSSASTSSLTPHYSAANPFGSHLVKRLPHLALLGRGSMRDWIKPSSSSSSSSSSSLSSSSPSKSAETPLHSFNDRIKALSWTRHQSPDQKVEALSRIFTEILQKQASKRKRPSGLMGLDNLDFAASTLDRGRFEDSDRQWPPEYRKRPLLAKSTPSPVLRPAAGPQRMSMNIGMGDLRHMLQRLTHAGKRRRR